jgi:hypothetical protein
MVATARYGMPRWVTFGLGVWVVAWVIAGAVVFDSIRGLGEGGQAVVSAGEGLDETAAALDRAARGLHETADALGAFDTLSLFAGSPGEAVEQTADDVEALAARVRDTADDARTTGGDAEDAASVLSIVLGLAVALGPTVPAIVFYLVFRSVFAGRREVAV